MLSDRDQQAHPGEQRGTARSRGAMCNVRELPGLNLSAGCPREVGVCGGEDCKQSLSGKTWCECCAAWMSLLITRADRHGASRAPHRCTQTRTAPVTWLPVWAWHIGPRHTRKEPGTCYASCQEKGGERALPVKPALALAPSRASLVSPPFPVGQGRAQGRAAQAGDSRSKCEVSSQGLPALC